MKIEIKDSKYFPYLIFSFLFLTFFSCKKDVEKNKEPVIPVRDTIVVEEEIKEPEYIITYHLDSLVNEVQIDSFETKFSSEQKRIILALNRLDETRLKVGTQIVVPDSLFSDIIYYSPFPKVFAVLESIPKTVLINQRIQGFALYENGRLIKWGPVSSGKASTPTPNGLHYGNYKAKRKVSTVNDDWLLPYYFNFMNFEGVGVHQYLLPGFPASHACVRLRMDDAKYIYDWARQWELDEKGRTVVKNGTPFMVFGEYDFQAPFPRQELVSNENFNKLTANEINVIKEYVEDYMEDPRNFAREEKSKDLLAAK